MHINVITQNIFLNNLYTIVLQEIPNPKIQRIKSINNFVFYKLNTFITFTI